MRSQRHLRARVGKDLLVTVTTSDFPLKKKEPLDSSEHRRDLV